MSFSICLDFLYDVRFISPKQISFDEVKGIIVRA